MILCCWSTTRRRWRIALGRSYAAALESNGRRLDNFAVTCLNEWGEYQRFFDRRVLVFVEAAEIHRDEGHMVFARLDLAESAIAAWSRIRLGNKQASSEGQFSPKDGKGRAAAPFIALTICLALAGRASAEAQSLTHLAVLVDLSPSMKPYRAQQLSAVKKTLESWKPNQVIDILGLNENPLGRPEIGHVAPFFYDGTKSNPVRFQIESTILRKKYLGTILPAVERAIADEDEKNKNRNPGLAETCLVDGLEAAARAFRRVSSQLREILLLTDGFEDCRDSIHLPRERLTPSRIATIIDQFERQNRLPRFVDPVTAHIVGMRLNDAYPRSYEDSVETFWIQLLKRCGIQVRPENFTPTLLGARAAHSPLDDLRIFLVSRAPAARWTPSKPNRQGPLS